MSIKFIVDMVDVLDALVDRVSYWTYDDDEIKLFETMYKNTAHKKFNNKIIDRDMNSWVMDVVDNDYINYCNVIDDTDDRYAQLLELARANKYDVSYEHIPGVSFIEAFDEDNGLILTRV